jgi:hypothetical protein
MPESAGFLAICQNSGRRLSKSLARKADEKKKLVCPIFIKPGLWIISHSIAANADLLGANDRRSRVEPVNPG